MALMMWIDPFQRFIFLGYNPRRRQFRRKISLRALKDLYNIQMCLLVWIQIVVILPLPVEIKLEDFPMLSFLLEFQIDWLVHRNLLIMLNLHWKYQALLMRMGRNWEIFSLHALLPIGCKLSISKGSSMSSPGSGENSRSDWLPNSAPHALTTLR